MSTGRTISNDKNLDTILKVKMPAVGIDIGGTKILAAAINVDGIIGTPIKIPTPSGPANIIKAIVEIVEKFKREHVLAGVGISTAGIVVESGTVVGATGNIPGWTGTPVKQIIESQTLLPTYVVNDANAAAYAEAHTRKLKDKECVVVLTIGTGVGGSILINGKLFLGEHHGAGHCGHIKVSMDNKRLCTCGLFDCYEAYASGVGLLTTAKEVLATVTAKQSEMVSIQGLKNADIFEALDKGDLVAKKIIDLWHTHLTAGMISLAHILNPDCFVLGGGLCKFIDIDLITERLIDNTLPPIAEHLKVYCSDLGNDAGMIGAAQLILDRLSPSHLTKF